MEIFAIVVMVALALVAAYFFWENGNLHKRIVAIDAQLREAQHAKSKPSKSSKSEKADKVVAPDPELERDLDDARNEIKDLKKQVYDLKTKSKGLKHQLKDATADRTSAAPDSEMIFELREQIAELTTDNARLEDELDEAKSKRPAPKPARKEEKPEPPPAASATAATSGADTESVRAKYEKELDGLRDEVRDLNRKLKSTASNIDKQRRRADNNDRAYKITQRQYDAAQERVSLLEAQLDHAGVEPVPLAELKARAPEVSSEPARRTPAAIAADEAAAEAEKAAAEQAKAEEQAKPEAPRPPAMPAKKEEPTEKAAPAPPPMPGAMVRKTAKPESEVGSTTVLSPMALANVAKDESVDEEPEGEGTTVHRAKPITAADLSGSIPKPKIKPPVPKVKERDSEAHESGGHTAMLTPGALAQSVSPAEEKSEPAADESGGHTAVLSAASLGKAVTGEQSASDESDEGSDDVRESGERTAILSAGAFATAESEAEEADEPAAATDPEGGRRPSAGLFGMPDDVFQRPEEEEADPVRSTQFAFPTQMVSEADDESGGTAKFAPVDGAELTPSRLGGGLKGDDNPADKPVPDAADDDQKDDKRLGGGGRLGDLDLGDLGSAIDDAWGDLDVD